MTATPHHTKPAAASPWGVERLDLDAYLRRVAYDGDTAPSVRTLFELHRAHVAAIPFENLDVALGRGIDVDLDAVQGKLVARRRGGYCYEHNLLFAAALERLGYAVERFLARVGGEGERPRARTHLTLRVHAGGRAWLADVGFGSGLLEPLSFDVRAPQAQGGWAYELAATGPAAWELREREAGRWAPAYSFEDQRVHPADVVMANHFSSTFPTSPFVTRTVAVRKDERAVRRLLDRTYGVTRPDGSVEERELGDAEIASTLREVFALPLDDDQVRRLIAGLPAARSAHP